MKEAGSKKKLLIWIAAGVLLCFTAALSRGIFGAASAKDVFGMLSDSCILTGVLLGGLGGLSYMASEGFYDIFSYGIKTVWKLFRTGKPAEQFVDYKEEKAKARGPWLKQSLFTGLGFFILSGVFLLLYHFAA